MESIVFCEQYNETISKFIITYVIFNKKRNLQIHKYAKKDFQMIHIGLYIRRFTIQSTCAIIIINILYY